ncbi:AMP-binding protein [Longispora albida]|uniref:AMP-binding protein n=1 Tax=Longispora albida TaxID=203523 RepID=UPI00036368F9|nr:AMP-binding protein [Longispora albida]
MITSREYFLPALNGTFPDKPDAVRAGGEQVSWARLRERAERTPLAPAIAVIARPDLDTIAAITGAILAGVAVVPIPPDSGPLEREHILTDSGAGLLIDGTEVTELPGGKDPDAALLLYTSGTTGAPKGVRLGLDALAAGLDGLAGAWQWTAGDTLVHGLPLFHVHGLVLGVLGALRTGSRLVHTGKPTPQAYAQAQGTLYFGVPTVWSRVCAEPSAAAALRPARLLVSGSAALPSTVFTALEGLTGHRPVERYGMTETLITISARADGDRRPGHVGTPLPGVLTRLTAEGELEIGGPTLFGGYLNRPSPFTVDGWFPTGDIAAVEDGQYRIVGRASTDLIKTGGFRVGAGEVENALLCHPRVREAAVIGVPDDDLGQAIVAYVVGEDVTERELIDFVAGQLSVHKRPRKVRIVADLPRNALGKVQKQQLR